MVWPMEPSCHDFCCGCEDHLIKESKLVTGTQIYSLSSLQLIYVNIHHRYDMTRHDMLWHDRKQREVYLGRGRGPVGADRKGQWDDSSSSSLFWQNINQNRLGEERDFSACASKLNSMAEGTQVGPWRWERKQRPWRMLLLAHSPSLAQPPYTARDHLPAQGRHRPHSAGPSYITINQENAHKPIWRRRFFSWGFSLGDV